jgi:hypothetical protein
MPTGQTHLPSVNKVKLEGQDKHPQMLLSLSQLRQGDLHCKVGITSIMARLVLSSVKPTNLL